MTTTTDRREALELAFALAQLELMQAGHSPELRKDDEATRRAGYDIYRGETFAPWVSDLGDRFEVNGRFGTTKNIWIDETIF